MSLTQEEQEQALDWINQHSQPTPPACPICQSGDWAVENTLYALKRLEKKRGKLQIEEAQAPGGQKAKILVSLVCKNCGHTMLFEAKKMGIV